jgi:hypothetical protein
MCTQTREDVMENPRIKFRDGYTQAMLVTRISERVTMVNFIRSDGPITLGMIGDMVEQNGENKTQNPYQTVTVNFPAFPPYIFT